MRYPALEKLEIIRTVEVSHLPVKQTLLRVPAASLKTLSQYGDRYHDKGDAERCKDKCQRQEKALLQDSFCVDIAMENRLRKP